MGKPRILCLTPYFLPSQKGGGSVTALVSLVERLRGDFDFVIATGDHDLHTPTPFAEDARRDARLQMGVEIHYVPSGWAAIPVLLELLRQDWHLLYLNSFLSRIFGALPLLLRSRRHAVLLAPRGELMDGALGVRRRQKLLYLRALRSLGALRGVRWHATSAIEAQQLRVHGVTGVEVAADLPPLVQAPLPPLSSAGPGPLRMVYLSRIEAKKNLLFALETLHGVKAPVEFSIVGPVGDTAYWAKCQQAMATLPANVRVRYLGAVSPSQVLATLSDHELFILPTLAENNGYVIHEALLAGCQLVISDQTPWRQLALEGIGDDLPLRQAEFAAAITRYAELQPDERLAGRQRARQFGLKRLAAEADVSATRDLLRRRGRS